MIQQAKLIHGGLEILALCCGGDKLVPIIGKRCFLVGRNKSQRKEG